MKYPEKYDSGDYAGHPASGLVCGKLLLPEETIAEYVRYANVLRVPLSRNHKKREGSFSPVVAFECTVPLNDYFQSFGASQLEEPATPIAILEDFSLDHEHLIYRSYGGEGEPVRCQGIDIIEGTHHEFRVSEGKVWTPAEDMPVKLSRLIVSLVRTRITTEDTMLLKFVTRWYYKGRKELI